MLADQGVFDAAGHVSMRHPGDPQRFLMSRSLAPALVTAGDIMEFTLEQHPVRRARPVRRSSNAIFTARSIGSGPT